jgi:solute carrier family 25 carnitine/acylcarnitine transporter 20/29
MTTKLRNVIYPKPITEFTMYGFDDSNNNDKDKDKNKDKDKDKNKEKEKEKYNPEKQNSILSNYINGGLSGMCGVLLSHPLDTIKTHIQTGNKLRTFKPSFTNFYKGISAPLLGVGIEKAIVFGTYNYMMTKTDNIPLSGAISGLVASFIVTPYERFKILKQNSQVFTIKDINIRFLFTGLNATFTREMPGFAIYFSVYEYLKKKNFTNHNKNIDMYRAFVYGGASGLMSWIFIYPQDKIKTIMQSNLQSSNCKSYTSLVKNMYNTYGLTYFYKGFSWAAGRAVLLHSGTFCTMEYLNKNNNNNTNTKY